MSQAICAVTIDSDAVSLTRQTHCSPWSELGRHCMCRCQRADYWFNWLRPRHNNQQFVCIFFNENIWISINISQKFIHEGQTNNIQALVQIMAWCRPGDRPLADPMIVSLLTHICVTRPHWVNVRNDRFQASFEFINFKLHFNDRQMHLQIADEISKYLPMFSY